MGRAEDPKIERRKMRSPKDVVERRAEEDSAPRLEERDDDVGRRGRGDGHSRNHAYYLYANEDVVFSGGIEGARSVGMAGALLAALLPATVR